MCQPSPGWLSLFLSPARYALVKCPLALLILPEYFLPRIPAALVALFAGIAISFVFGLEERGVEVVVELPAGLTAPQ